MAQSIIRGSVMGTPEGAAANPANAGFVDRTQVQFAPHLFKTESYRIRYPGFESSEQGDSGIQAPLAIPRFIAKIGNLGVGGIVAPPGLALPVEIKRIPVIVLKTLNYFDINGEATVNMFANAVVGYRFGNLGLGVSGDFASAGFKADLVPSSGGDPLVSINGSATIINVRSGVRWDVVPGRFALGVSVVVLKSSSLDLKFESPLLGDVAGGAGGEGDPGGQAGKPSTTSNPLDQIQFGVQLALSQKVRLLADGLYTRADKSQTMFSLVDLTDKPRDVHDTFAVSGNVVLNVADGRNLSVWVAHDPARIGKGSQGADGLSGFGTLDVVMTKLPGGVGEPLLPRTSFGAGAQFGFMPKSDKPPGKKAKAVYYYALTLATGIVYERASLGIDEDGELPGAYLQTSTSIPVDITYKF